MGAFDGYLPRPRSHYDYCGGPRRREKKETRAGNGQGWTPPPGDYANRAPESGMDRKFKDHDEIDDGEER